MIQPQIEEEEQQEKDIRVVGMLQVWVRFDRVVTAWYYADEDPIETALDAARQELADQLGIDESATEWSEPEAVLAVEVEEDGVTSIYHRPKHKVVGTCNLCQHKPQEKPAPVAGEAPCSCDCHEVFR